MLAVNELHKACQTDRQNEQHNVWKEMNISLR